MKTIVKIIAVLTLLLAASCAQTAKDVQHNQAVPESQLYTAHNIWKIDKLLLRRCINYKHGDNILSAGTPVRKVKTGEDSRSGQPFISFVTVSDNDKYRIYFVSKWHPGKTEDDYKKFMFTTQTFDELTAGMTEAEIQSIRQGVVRNGMSKEAVLVSYGRPPEHRTPSLDSNVWIYWRNKLASFQICFDENDRTTLCK